jgi:hypothetical protein
VGGGELHRPHVLTGCLSMRPGILHFRALAMMAVAWVTVMGGSLPLVQGATPAPRGAFSFTGKVGQARWRVSIGRSPNGGSEVCVSAGCLSGGTTRLCRKPDEIRAPFAVGDSAGQGGAQLSVIGVMTSPRVTRPMVKVSGRPAKSVPVRIARGAAKRVGRVRPDSLPPRQCWSGRTQAELTQSGEGDLSGFRRPLCLPPGWGQVTSRASRGGG